MSSSLSFSSIKGRQRNEIEALKAIYLESFETLKETEESHKFAIHLAHGQLSCRLEFELSPEYPNEVPLMNLSKKKNLTNQISKDLVKIAQDTAQQSLGSEMIFDIIEAVKQKLQDPKVGVSFYDEMVERQISEQQDFEKKLQQQEAQKAKKLQTKINRVIEAKSTLAQKALSTIPEVQTTISPSSSPSLTFEPEKEFYLFEPPIIYNCESFSMSIDSISLIDRNGLDGWFTVRAIDRQIEFSFLLVDVSKVTQQRRIFSALKQINEASQLPSHPLVRNIIGAQLKDNQLVILSEQFPKNSISLQILLAQMGRIECDKALVILVQILSALQHVHRNNFVHKDLSCLSVLVGFGTEGLHISLIGVHWQYELNYLKGTEAFSKRLWEPTERCATGKKFDLWCLGLVAIQILFGPEVLTEYADFDGLRHALLANNSGWTAFFDAIFRYEENVSVPFLLQILSSLGSFTHKKPFPNLNTQSLNAKPFSTASIGIGAQQSASRYEMDFEELEILGQGGFGQVLKVRNRIDGRLYAIKRLALDPEDVDHNRRILREVLALSRLQHDRIVRYYQAWIESYRPASLESKDKTSKNRSDDFDVGNSTDEDTSFEIDFGHGNSQADWMESGATLSLSRSPSSDVMFEKLTTETRPSSKTQTTSSISNELKDMAREILYIQMEYCPNKTLREAIDERLVTPELAWRYLRQVVEGLVYLHSQGMIHRDLKPGNVFLDSAGNAKLGDFGLAAMAGHFTASTSSIIPHKGHRGFDLTGGVGTPLYIPPEQQQSSNITAYDDKADMFSLGILVLELFLPPFPTEMERIQTIKRARNHGEFPEALSKIDDRVEDLLSKLITQDPKERISSSELLKGAYLPAKLEDENVEETIRSIADPSGSHYQKLLECMFKETDPLKDFAFDLQPPSLLALSELRKTLMGIFELNGSAEFYPPSFQIWTSGNPDPSTVKVMDSWGQVLQLPSDLCRPYARYLARHLSDPNLAISSEEDSLVTKRWAMDRVYRINQPATQPKAIWEIDFDVCILPFSQSETNNNSINYKEGILEFCEVAIAGINLLTMAVESHRLTLVLGHDFISHLACQRFGIDYEGLVNLQTLPPTKRRLLLESKGILVFPELSKYLLLSNEPIEDALKKVCEFLPRNDQLIEAIDYLTQLTTQLNSYLKRKIRIIFDPLLKLASSNYQDNVVFQFILSNSSISSTSIGGSGKRQPSEIVAIGGRYDKLIDSYRFPSGSSNKHLSKSGPIIGAVNIVFGAAKMSVLFQKRPYPLVYEIVGGRNHQEAFQVAQELRDSGLPCITFPPLHHPVALQIILEERKHYKSTPNYIKIVKCDHRQQRQEIASVTRSELVSYLQQYHQHLLTSGSATLGLSSVVSSSSAGSAGTLDETSVGLDFIFPKNLPSGPSSKLGIKERASRALTPSLTTLTAGGKLVLAVVVHDLTLSALAMLLVGTGNVTGSDKEEFQRVKDVLANLKHSSLSHSLQASSIGSSTSSPTASSTNNAIAALYSIKGNRVDYYIL